MRTKLYPLESRRRLRREALRYLRDEEGEDDRKVDAGEMAEWGLVPTPPWSGGGSGLATSGVKL
jgi:hypothetical protein